MQERIRQLEALLAPFAKAAFDYTAGARHGDWSDDMPETSGAIEVGDLRRVQAFLSRVTPQGDAQ